MRHICHIQKVTAQNMYLSIAGFLFCAGDITSEPKNLWEPGHCIHDGVNDCAQLNGPCGLGDLVAASLKISPPDTGQSKLMSLWVLGTGKGTIFRPMKLRKVIHFKSEFVLKQLIFYQETPEQPNYRRLW